MRLVCPNCGAQYEVDDRVIPDSGRDVQCSNCGHSWFQRGAGWQHEHDPQDETPQPDELPDEAFEEHRSATSQAASDSAPASEPDLEPEPEPESEPASNIEPEPDVTPAAEPAPEPAPQRELDAETRSILQEEAARELAAREREAASMEVQEDLGLEETGEAPASSGLKARMARLRGLDHEAATEVETGPRRDLLPDIEEINSSLNSVSDRDDFDDFADPAARNRASFGRGFGLVLLLAVLAVLLYILAPRIGDMVPALAPVLDSYLAFVDGLRDQLDALMQRAITAMQNATWQ
ncbi:MAG TPA: hypothetical protein ENK83_06285 [Aliiroseovarius sp.]|nr:hypothetical protein [Aliiroseovarius sp.]